MKTTSLFVAYVKKYFKGLVGTLTEKINGKKEDPTYLYQLFFKKKFEPTLKFESLMSNGNIAAADVVAVDSELPLKSRDSISKSEGDIPKIGMKLALRESEMNNIDYMVATSNNGSLTGRVIQLLFGDTKKCIQGVYARLEIMGLQALSTGVTSITAVNNNGVTDRIEFAIPTANQTGASVIWSSATTAKPLDDIEAILETARGNGDKLKHVLMSQTSFNQFKKTTQAKERYASFLNFSGTAKITPSLTKANEFMLEDYGLTIMVIDVSVQTEKNGKKTVVKPWEEGKITLLPSLDAGSLSYSTSAEERRPVPGVHYEKADDFMLISKYSVNEPLAEFTAVQAYVIPVLNDVESIYQMNSILTSWE